MTDGLAGVLLLRQPRYEFHERHDRERDEADHGSRERSFETAMGILNTFFWLGGALYQHLSGMILGSFALVDGRIPVTAYQALFWFGLASVAVSAILVALTHERQDAAAAAR